MLIIFHIKFYYIFEQMYAVLISKRDFFKKIIDPKMCIFILKIDSVSCYITNGYVFILLTTQILIIYF